MEKLHKISNNNQAEILQELGLSEKEALIYLAALETGGGTVAELSEAVGIERTGIYYHLDKLLGLKVLKTLKRGAKIVYLPADPERLKKILETRQNKFYKTFPLFQEQFSHQTSKSLIEFYEGEDEVNKFYDRVYELFKKLKPPYNEIYCFGNSYRMVNKIPIFMDFTPPKSQIDIKLKTILPEFQKSPDTKENAMDPYIVTRYNLPASKIKYISDKYRYRGSTVIMHDRLVLYDFRNLTYSIIVNENLANLWRMVFEFMWNHL